MKDKHGENWWDTAMTSRSLQDIHQKVQDRMTSEKKHSYHGKRGSHPIYYSDFGDLMVILKAKTTDFNPYFNNLTGKLLGFLTKLQEIEPSRNVAAHHNPLAPRDIQRVYGYLADWTAQLAYLNDANLLP